MSDLPFGPPGAARGAQMADGDIGHAPLAAGLAQEAIRRECRPCIVVLVPQDREQGVVGGVLAHVGALRPRIARATTTPERKVSAPTPPMAQGRPNASLMTPAIRAPTA